MRACRIFIFSSFLLVLLTPPGFGADLAELSRFGIAAGSGGKDELGNVEGSGFHASLSKGDRELLSGAVSYEDAKEDPYDNRISVNRIELSGRPPIGSKKRFYGAFALLRQRDPSYSQFTVGAGGGYRKDGKSIEVILSPAGEVEDRVNRLEADYVGAKVVGSSNVADLINVRAFLEGGSVNDGRKEARAGRKVSLGLGAKTKLGQRLNFVLEASYARLSTKRKDLEGTTSLLPSGRIRSDSVAVSGAISLNW